MAGWEVPLGIVLTVVGGMALAVQAGVNASLASHTNKSVAAVLSFGIGLAACCLYLLLDATALSKHLPSVGDMQGAPWWAWVGGVLGAYYVIINISFAYKLGAGTAVAVFVCSQLGTSIILDLTGMVGFQKRAFSWPRITGAALMIMGVVLVTQFPGDPVLPPKPADPEAQQQQQQQQQQQRQPMKKLLANPEEVPEASEGSLIPVGAVDGRIGSSSTNGGSSSSMRIPSSFAIRSSSSSGGGGGVQLGTLRVSSAFSTTSSSSGGSSSSSRSLQALATAWKQLQFKQQPPVLP